MMPSSPGGLYWYTGARSSWQTLRRTRKTGAGIRGILEGLRGPDSKMSSSKGMSGGGTFDPYADQYDATVQSAISASGESVAFFADLKARLARERAPDLTRSVLDFGCGVGNVSRAM